METQFVGSDGSGKPSLSSKLAATKAAYMNKSIDMASFRARPAPPSSARPTTSSGASMRPGSSSGRGSRPGGGRGGGTGGPNMNARPLALTCYLCGTQHFGQSLFHHLQACQKKWMMVEDAKSARERRPLPPPPPELTEDLPRDTLSIEAFNAAMYAYWPDAFEKHVTVCTPDNPGGPLGMPKSAAAAKLGSAATSAATSSPYSKVGGVNGTPGGRPTSSRPQPGGGGAVRPGGGNKSNGYGTGGGPNMNSKPRAFTCYLCGTQHFSQRALPAPPQELTEDLPSEPQGIDAFNASMYAYWDRVSLIVCNICTRSFRADAYEKHVKVCTLDNPGGPLGMPKNAAAAKTVPAGGGGGGAPGGGRGMTRSVSRTQRPRALMCYLCGTQHFGQSLLIHIPQCYEKWLKVEAQKDRKERRDPPPPPPELDQPLPSSPEGIDLFNQRMSDVYNGRSLMQCAHCGRTMRPDALVRHQNACTAEKPMKSAATRPSASEAAAAAGGGSSRGRDPSEQPEGDMEMDQCDNCGRRMRPDALLKHNKVCTPDKPMKAVPSSRGGPAGSALNVPPAGPSPPPGAPRPAAGGRRPVVPESASSPSSNKSSGGAGQGMKSGYEEGEEDNPPPKKYSYPDPPANSGQQGSEDDRIQCQTCGRRFGEDAFEKHVRVCAKVFASKRKVFDSTKARLAGTEAASLYKGGKAPPPPGRPGVAGGTAPRAAAASQQQQAADAVPKWKAQSESLRTAMQNMRQLKAAMARGENIRDIPYVPSAPDPSFIQCPHCSRRFNAKAAERHIPACANTVSKPKFLKAGTGGSGQGAPQSKHLPKW
ncbi:hypothetical protein CEUSTIGMA_g10376.t1 [Chlamydomonas eustigma]|uniref:C2HC/C3H-type domain-containing protein n=1 Tax=Chlamydomonas eustigma TaxID=1157962 RepID=A0A250XJ53_9CHLO|nr:hypothetical protein CEUSTIGMA_g10376.t1 [Chlamydomonas eustigma]|eukprot:GAX82949.1 hypothetical protein CEUSTIGMA_g10376.t1 [Chlamydomonas eustigma]